MMASRPAGIPNLSVPSRARRLALGASLGLAVALLLGALRGSDLVEALELKLVDVRTRHYAATREPDARIVLAQIEEEDVEWGRRELGVPWPWSLEYNAYIVDVLKAAGARCLMVDILHLDKGAGPDDAPEGPPLSEPQKQARDIEALAADTYATALRAFGRAVIPLELSDRPKFDVPARRTASESKLAWSSPEAPAGARAYKGAELPVRRVAEGAARIGFSNAPEALDGVVRRASVVARWGTRPVPSLAWATFALAADDTDDTETVEQPLMNDASFLVNFRSRQTLGVYERVPPSKILHWAVQMMNADGQVPAEAKEALQGKIVVLGINLAGLKDVVPCPLGGMMDGPVYQATVLDNLLHADGRVRAPGWLNALVLLMTALLLGLLGGALHGRLWPHLVPLVAALLLVASAFAAFGAGTSIDLLTPFLAVLLTWGGSSALRLMTEGRRNKWLEGTFGRYMAPPIIEALKQDPSLLALGGREREITIFFSDVANFTRHSTQLTAPQLVSLLNHYLTAHCGAVMDEGGVVDKFEGDAVMAFFGDPVPTEDHALRAARTALRVIAELPLLRPVWAEMGLTEFRIRIGLNTGSAVVGNMGSEQRFDYTCMGDAVNLASRLESAAKVFGVDILVGESTAQALEGKILMKPLGQVVVVGRQEPVGIFELLADLEQAPEALREHARAFEEALEAARTGDTQTARRALAKAEQHREGDRSIAWFRSVLDTLEFDGAKAAAWDGITVLGSK